MLPPDLIKLMLVVAQNRPSNRREAYDALRRDLSDREYADWFLSGKFSRAGLNRAHAMNDFVLFRIAFSWPKGAVGWTLDQHDIILADFSLDDVQAADLVDMAREGLSDGYTSAEWFAKVAASWHVTKEKRMPDALFEYLQQMLFLPPAPRRGRRKTEGLDRDRVIRNLVEGLLARNLAQPAAITLARSVAVEALGRIGIGMTEDAIRKLCERSARTNRELRLWGLLTGGMTLERKG